MKRFASSSRILRAASLAACLSLGLLTDSASACPNCRDSLPNGQQRADGTAEPNVAKGFAWSIYLMIGVPYLMVAAMGTTAFVLIRKHSVKMQGRSNEI